MIMEAVKKPLSIKIIYWTTSIAFWIFVVVAILGTALVSALMLNVFEGDLQLHVGLPVGINIVETGILDLDLSSKYIDVQFTEMVGKIQFKDTPADLGRIYGGFMLIILGIFLYIFIIFRRFITNVYNGVYFDLDNIALLKRISYALVLVWGFTVFYSYFQYFYIAQNLQFNSIVITNDVQTYSEILVGALFIWVLSHIFMKGCELQDEHNYTV
jgi:hypothetical protein